MDKPFSPTVAILTIAGVIPFIISAFLAFEPEGLAHLMKRDFEGIGLSLYIAQTSLLAYAGAILSFMAGIRWGSELTRGRQDISPVIMVLAVIPAILAWAFMLVGALPGAMKSGTMFILAGAFLMLLAWDATARYPRWYLYLRIFATFCAAGSLIAVAFKTLPT